MTIEYTTGSSAQVADSTWYRGEHCNFNPTTANMRTPDAIEEYILHGWLPEAPFIERSTRITAFGSCFATHISDYLNERDFMVLTKQATRAHVVDMGEGIVNSYAIRQQFDWAFRGIVPSQPLWHGYRAEEFGYDEDVRRNTREMFERTDVFILTFGLAEVWYDEPTGEVFWRAVPERMFDPSRHRFRVTTVAENVTNIRATYDLIREFVPDARVIFTLSPIPLVATFRPQSCISANSVSKAVLRAAIDEVHREVAADGHLHYWPSYEVIESAFGAGRYIDDRRHIQQPILDYMMGLFETYYCVDSSPTVPIRRARLRAMLSAGEIGEEAVLLAERADAAALEPWIRSRLAADDPETAALVCDVALESNPESQELRRLAGEMEGLPVRPVIRAPGSATPARHRRLRSARRALRSVRSRLGR